MSILVSNWHLLRRLSKTTNIYYYPDGWSQGSATKNFNKILVDGSSKTFGKNLA